jgi:hypothetical protein
MPLSRRYTPSWAPSDASNIGMDFSYVVPPGVGIVLGQLSIWTNTATPISVDVDFVVGPIQVFGRTIYTFLEGGAEGRDYQLRWVAIDTDGNRWQRTALMLCAQTS